MSEANLPGRVTDGVSRLTERSPSAAIAITSIVVIGAVLGGIIWKLLDALQESNLHEHEIVLTQQNHNQQRLMYILEHWEPKKPVEEIPR